MSETISNSATTALAGNLDWFKGLSIVKNTEWKVVEVNGEEVEIPADWDVRQISQLTKITAGQSSNSEYLSASEKGLEFHQGNSHFGVKHLKASPRFILKEHAKKVSPPNSILISVRAPVGALNLSNRSVAIGRGLAALTPYESPLNWVYYALRDISWYISSLGAGSTFDAITMPTLGEVQLSTPLELEEQTLIASALTHQESLVEITTALISKMELRLKWFSRELLSGRLRLREVSSSETELDMYKNTEWKVVEVNGEEVEIPADWDVCEIKSAIDFTIGNTPKKEGDNYKGTVPWITISNIKGKFISNYTAHVLKTETIKELPAGTLLGSFKMSIGRFAFTTCNCATNEAIIAIKPTDTIDYYLPFLYYYLPSIFKENTTTNGQGSELLNTTTIKTLEIIKLSKKEQTLIADFLTSLEDQIEDYKKLLLKEQQKLKWLSTNLLSGKYRLVKLT